MRSRTRAPYPLAAALATAAALTAVPIAAGTAHAAADNVVRDGHARFEVLTPTLVRLEYAADDQFADATTFNAQHRDLPTPPFTSAVENGWRVIRTARLTVRYQQNSGPFTQANTAVDLTVAGRAVTAHPRFGGQAACAFGSACEAEDAVLTGGTQLATDHTGYSGKGFGAGYEATGATASWTLSGVPAAGDYTVAVRYANDRGSDGQVTTRTLTLTAGGAATTVNLPPTGGWDSWADATATVHVPAGASPLAVTCGSGNSCRVNVDRVAVFPVGQPIPGPTPPAPSTNLGGYYRGLDGQSGPVPLHDGLLDTAGWYLLDDTQTALWTPSGFPRPRPAHQGAYQDGYFFGYGHDYRTGLHDLAALTGPSPLLPEWAFGNWYSRYQAYTTGDYENTLLPTFRSEHVPLDVLVIDTDFKHPSTWDGWNWNPDLFPNPQAFLDWTKAQGLHVTLNVHSSIDSGDPQFAAANAKAGGLINNGGTNYVWDWSDPAHVDSYFSVHQPFEQQGVRFWWLDWCCDNSRSSMPGLTPDSWINQLYTADLTSKGERGFAFSRLGSSNQDYSGTYPSGPWGEHRSTVHFTGDTFATWDMLNFENYFTIREGNIGLPYVTHDIGSFHGGHLADDMYVRWLQMGAFQPIDRLHSDHAPRLPWEYDDAARVPAEKFMRLRESLVPYLYTTARQSYDTGVPMTRGLYLDYPDSPEAYQFDHEYMLGDQMLVAPVGTPGAVASTQVWFPPGTWVDYFTGAQVTGPATRTVNSPLDRMPVYVKAGAVLPTQPYADHQTSGIPTLLRVDGNAAGSSRYYEDAGDGLGYQHGEFAWTQVDHAVAGGDQTVTIGGAAGSYPGQPANRRLQLDLTDVTQPGNVLVNGSPLPASAWRYDATTRTVHADLPVTATKSAVTVRFAGARRVAVAPPPAVGFALAAPALTAGQAGTVTATVTNYGPGPIDAAAASLPVPAGWTAAATTPTTLDQVPAGGTGTVRWQVSAPAPAGPIDTAQLTGHLTYRYGSPALAAGQDTTATAYVAGPVAAPYRTYHSAPTGYFGQSGDQLGIVADGADVWGGSDEYGAIYRPAAAGAAATAMVRVAHQDGTDPWAKSGLMLRGDMTGAGASTGYAMVAVTPGNGVAFQWDSDGDGRLDGNVNTGTTPAGPVWLRLVRGGTGGGTVTAAYSTDGSTWTTVGSATVPGATPTEDVGVFTSAHGTEPGLATFDHLTVS